LLPSAYFPAVGGVEVLTAALAGELTNRGHRIEVWAARSECDHLADEEIVDGIQVRRFVFPLPRADARALVRFPAASFATLRKLKSEARRFRPDVLHVQCFSGNGAYATALSALIGSPLVISLQGETVMDDSDIYDHSASLRALLRMGLWRAAAVTGCSDFTLHDAQARFGLDRRKAEVIFNGVDADETEPVQVALPFERYVLGLGRIVRKKGFDLLLEAFARVAAAHTEVGLVVAGQGPESDWLRQRAVELGVADRFHMPGRMNRGQAAAVMGGAEVFVLPSRIEPFGMVILEAWRAGVPVVVSPYGGPSEFVEHEISGVIADPLDPIDLARAIDSLLAAPALRARLATEGLSKLPRFGWGTITERYEATYVRVVRAG
jgi:glycosyltransferase involved in cell wall biosynthesis